MKSTPARRSHFTTRLAQWQAERTASQLAEEARLRAERRSRGPAQVPEQSSEPQHREEVTALLPAHPHEAIELPEHTKRSTKETPAPKQSPKQAANGHAASQVSLASLLSAEKATQATVISGPFTLIAAKILYSNKPERRIGSPQSVAERLQAHREREAQEVAIVEDAVPVMQEEQQQPTASEAVQTQENQLEHADNVVSTLDTETENYAPNAAMSDGSSREELPFLVHPEEEEQFLHVMRKRAVQDPAVEQEMQASIEDFEAKVRAELAAYAQNSHRK